MEEVRPTALTRVAVAQPVSEQRSSRTTSQVREVELADLSDSVVDTSSLEESVAQVPEDDFNNIAKLFLTSRPETRQGAADNSESVLEKWRARYKHNSKQLKKKAP